MWVIIENFMVITVNALVLYNGLKQTLLNNQN